MDLLLLPNRSLGLSPRTMNPRVISLVTCLANAELTAIRTAAFSTPDDTAFARVFEDMPVMSWSDLRTYL
jgi:hypothetical protein